MDVSGNIIKQWMLLNAITLWLNWYRYASLFNYVVSVRFYCGLKIEKLKQKQQTRPKVTDHKKVIEGIMAIMELILFTNYPNDRYLGLVGSVLVWCN